MPRTTRRRGALLLACALLLTACGGSGDDAKDGDAEGGDEQTFVAQIASYELLAGAPQRFLTGLVVSGEGSVVSFGEVELEFFFLGTRENPIDPPQSKSKASAVFVPIAGRDEPPKGTEPSVVKPSEGLGVYKADAVTFDAPGFWGVRVSATVDGDEVTANAAFEVKAEAGVPAPGAPAPRTENPTIASAGANAKALDSRADEDTPVPDEALHGTTVAAALAEGRPVVVVVSTPAFCVSRFCGPITDSVEELAGTYGDRAAFVHIEVWEDFEQKKIAPAARAWIEPTSGGDLQEPWVFLVGGDGVVKERFDNVVSDADLEAAVKRLVGA